MKKFFVFSLLAICCIMLSGCGETIGGVGKDASRIGKGVKTIFIKDSSQ